MPESPWERAEQQNQRAVAAGDRTSRQSQAARNKSVEGKSMLDLARPYEHLKVSIPIFLL